MALEVLTAAKIAEIAFTAVIETGAGKLTEGTLVKAKQLWQKILDRLQNKPNAQTALTKIENGQSTAESKQVIARYLDVEMMEDEQFAQELQVLAQQYNQEIQEGSQDNMQMHATSYDQSTLKQVGKIDADTVSF